MAVLASTRAVLCAGNQAAISHQRLYFAATRLAISHIIVTPRRMFSTDIRSLFPWIVPSSSNGMTTGMKP